MIDTPAPPSPEMTVEQLDAEATAIIQEWIDAVNVAQNKLAAKWIPWAAKVNASSLAPEMKMALIKKTERQIDEGLIDDPSQLGKE